MRFQIKEKIETVKAIPQRLNQLVVVSITALIVSMIALTVALLRGTSNAY
jgi:hypothetical protein